jgi:hypothetical protein
MHPVWIKVSPRLKTAAECGFLRQPQEKKGICGMSPGGIFVQGIISVFFGMALLYLSIKITAFAVDKFSRADKGVGKDGK